MLIAHTPRWRRGQILSERFQSDEHVLISMPFSGRPSDACGPCRKGRLRVSSAEAFPSFPPLFSSPEAPSQPYVLQCDRARPSCTQCLRKSIICFGYRNVLQLLFKDESQSTARKVHWKRNGAIYPPILPEQSPEDRVLTVPNFNNLDGIPSPSCSVTPYYEELAVCYFMSSYVPTSPFEYLPQIYKSTASTAEDSISSTVLAASLASLSLHVGSDKLMNYARIHYSKALTRTNAALNSSKKAILDSSLLSVLLLGLYEGIAFTGRQSPESWTAHTLGAVQLIRLRGSKQLETNLGKRLFLQTCNNVRSSCIQRGVTVPDEFLRIYEQAKPFLEPSMPLTRLGPLIDKIASLKARVRQHQPLERLSGLIYEALQLDEEARALEDMLPDSWRYQIRPQHMTPSCAYEGLAHKYPAHRMARHWNSLRIIQLFLNEVIWQVAAFFARAKEEGRPEINRYCKDLNTEALQTVAAANHVRLVTDILASVPQFLNENGATFTPAARFLIWPLTIVAEISLTLEPARRYAIGCLYEIATQARFPQALQAARAVESGSSTDW